MKRVIVFFVGALCLGFVIGCATFRTSDGKINWAVILADAQFGVSAACSQQWLNAADCAIATDGITLAQSIIAKLPPNAQKMAVHQTLIDIEVKLPAMSRVRDFWDYIIALSA